MITIYFKLNHLMFQKERFQLKRTRPIHWLRSHLARAKRIVADILIGCLFVNLRLTYEPCLGKTIVSLYCFGSPKCEFSN